MKVKPGQLESVLQKSLSSVYFISGDEPLQLLEAADKIRSVAKKNCYTHREVLTADTDFDWNTLGQEACSLSLFSEKKIIDLRIPSGKPGSEGGKALVEYCRQPPSDTVLIISSGKISGAAKKTRWFQALEKKAVVIQVWPLQGNELMRWLQQRAKKTGLQIDNEGLKRLVSRVEGNLLAAAQEIEKLFVLHGQRPVTPKDIESLVADNARFDVFKLLDCMLTARVNKASRILQGLKVEGVAAPVVLWAVSREARTLYHIQSDLKQGLPSDRVFKKHQIWSQRQNIINMALNRLDLNGLEEILLLCCHADRQIKGRSSGDYWESLFSILIKFCAPGIKVETV